MEELIRLMGLERRRLMKSRGPYRRHSTQFKLQLCQDIRNGIIGRRDAQRTYSVSANLIQLWLTQFDRGELNDEEAEASVIAEYEARIAALERKVGQLTMELDLAKKTPRPLIAGDSERSFIITGPRPAPSNGGVK
jgi:transposase